MLSSFVIAIAMTSRPTYKLSDVLQRAAHPHGFSPDAADQALHMALRGDATSVGDSKTPTLTTSGMVGDFPFRAASGTFVSSCTEMDIDFGQGIVSKGGLMSVLDFNQQSSTLEVDTTIYVGDYTCVPADTETLAKYNTHWNVKYGAPSGSKFNRGGHLVQFDAINGKNLFQFDYPKNFTGVQSIFNDLNQQCQCSGGSGGRWTPKATRTIDQRKDCSSKDKAATLDTNDLCNLVLGNSYYTTILWRDSEHFWFADGAYDQVKGYMANVTRTDPYFYLPETKNQNPQSCGYMLLPKCKGGISTAKAECETCGGPGAVTGEPSLECEACLFNSFPKSSDQSATWGACCPCFWWTANDQHLPWLQVDC